MTLKHMLTLLVASSLFTGCAIHAAMHEIEDHYQAAQTHAKAKAYPEADAEVGKVEKIFASDDVVKADDTPRYAELHAELRAELSDLRAQLQAEDAEKTMSAFETASATCKACHEEF
jgi:hypothetical protein